MQRAITKKEAFFYWLKLGFISFGGPAGQIAIMHHDLVEKKRWISEKRFLHALNYCMLLPGPEAQQLATYIGWLMHRTLGGIMAGVLFVLPSLLIIICLAWVYLSYGHLSQVAGFFYGIKPAVVAIVLFAAYRLGSRVLKNTLLCAIAIAAFVAVMIFKIAFPWVILGAAILGFLGGKLSPKRFNVRDLHQAKLLAATRFIIDDDTPPPAHAQFRFERMMLVLLIGFSLWAMMMGVLTLQYGWHSVVTQMGLFFTKAAFLTFGGAYAVLPYVYQGAVETHQWLTPLQMMDGLALGEATPGPLIMIVAFIGFIGGASKAAFGVKSLFLSGALAACVTTFFTFLPSFLFILIGGPVIESSKNNLKLTAPLVGISAAVIGVIVSLAGFFAWHVVMPKGLAGNPDILAIIATLLAIVLLFKFKWNLIKLILLFGNLGVLHHFLRPLLGGLI